MSPELRAYLDHTDNETYPGGDADRGEADRLRALIPPGELAAHARAKLEAAYAAETAEWSYTTFSASRRYSLNVFRTSHYSRGHVYRHDSPEDNAGKTLIAQVTRNYASFIDLFIEGHANGHDYLVTGEDYQGQTVLELDTGKRWDFLPDGAYHGVGFCWVDIAYDEPSQILVVAGCHWACPYEYRLYDFSNPAAGWLGIEAKDDGFELDPRAPLITPTEITFYQSRCLSDQERAAKVDPATAPIDAYTVYARTGRELVKVREWVSDEETAVRAAQKAAHEAWEAETARFKLEDPLYQIAKAAFAAPPFTKPKYMGIGTTFNGWCPTWEGTERRVDFDLRLEGDDHLSLEWGTTSGPILLRRRKGDYKVDVWRPHTEEGMREILALAAEVLHSLAGDAGTPLA